MIICNTIDNKSQFMGKIIIYILGILFITTICFFLFLFATEWIWPEFNGSYSLGNNVYMMEWDGGGRIIVQGSNIRGNTCYGGDRLIPTYENQYDSTGNYAEYVVDAKADNYWVIAKTMNRLNNERKYYILSKQYDPNETTLEYIINTKIESFIDSCDFANKCQNYGIHIKW